MAVSAAKASVVLPNADTPAPTTPPAPVAAFRSVVTAPDFRVEDFLSKQLQILALAASFANVNPGSVRVQQVASGSVVVCWAAGLPDDTTLTNQQFSNKLIATASNQGIGLSIVSITYICLSPLFLVLLSLFDSGYLCPCHTATLLSDC